MRVILFTACGENNHAAYVVEVHGLPDDADDQTILAALDDSVPECCDPAMVFKPDELEDFANAARSEKPDFEATA